MGLSPYTWRMGSHLGKYLGPPFGVSHGGNSHLRSHVALGDPKVLGASSSKDPQKGRWCTPPRIDTKKIANLFFKVPGAESPGIPRQTPSIFGGGPSSRGSGVSWLYTKSSNSGAKNCWLLVSGTVMALKSIHKNKFLAWNPYYSAWWFFASPSD